MSSERVAAGLRRWRDRSGVVLVAAVGILIGALLMNLASPPGVQVVEVTGPGADGRAGGSQLPEGSSEVQAGESGATGQAGGPARAAGGGARGAASSAGARATAGAAPVGAARGGPAARGVTDTAVKIGFTFFNVGIYGVVPAYDVGPGLEKMQAVQRRWRREGRDVVHGRKIELVYQEYSITDEASQRAACISLVDDAKVFAVAAPAGLYSGSDCVTKEKKTPLVQTASTGGTAVAVQERAPYFFMVAPDRSQTSRNWAHWAHHRGLLAGKRLGFYYSMEETDELKQNFVAELRRLGYGRNVITEMTAPDEDEVGPEDTVAVNQFRADRVDLAVLLLNGLRMENFMQQAESQGYRPQYLASDLGVTTDDTKTATFPPTQWDKTYAMTSMLYGQRNAPLSNQSRICLDDYRAALRDNDNDRDPQSGSADFNYTMMSCDSLELAWLALNNAGRDLTVDSYIRGMEAVRNYVGAFTPSTSFGPGDHTGSDSQRTLQWQASCRCYQRVSDFAPFYLP